jgi:hypothetical protein
MRRIELWADEPERPHLRLSPKVISLETAKRARRDEARRAAYDEGTCVGFFLGICACGIVWVVLSGLLVAVAARLVWLMLWALGVR